MAVHAKSVEILQKGCIGFNIAKQLKRGDLGFVQTK